MNVAASSARPDVHPYDTKKGTKGRIFGWHCAC